MLLLPLTDLGVSFYYRTVVYEAEQFHSQSKIKHVLLHFCIQGFKVLAKIATGSYINTDRKFLQDLLDRMKTKLLKYMHNTPADRRSLNLLSNIVTSQK